MLGTHSDTPQPRPVRNITVTLHSVHAEKGVRTGKKADISQLRPREIDGLGGVSGAASNTSIVVLDSRKTGIDQNIESHAMQHNLSFEGSGARRASALFAALALGSSFIGAATLLGRGLSI